MISQKNLTTKSAAEHASNTYIAGDSIRRHQGKTEDQNYKQLNELMNAMKSHGT